MLAYELEDDQAYSVSFRRAAQSPTQPGDLFETTSRTKWASAARHSKGRSGGRPGGGIHRRGSSKAMQ